MSGQSVEGRVALVPGADRGPGRDLELISPEVQAAWDGRR